MKKVKKFFLGLIDNKFSCYCYVKTFEFFLLMTHILYRFY